MVTKSKKRARVQVVFDEPTMTKQSFKDQCDINNVMARYARTGTLPMVNERTPQYGDFSAITDYQSAMNAVLEAQESFMELPSKVRARFENDPGQFLDFFNDPANLDEAVELGLAVKPVLDTSLGSEDQSDVKSSE